ncbi:MAG: hypothetical protein KZQ83_19915 [gamma proteobacterium symbiont of Taylorina sp.]|nr:hypothetical protein [gamma proteobacterium symbiont of Taylorina sp.]
MKAKTLTEFLKNKQSRTMDQKLWFQKSERFFNEKEFRGVFFTCTGSSEKMVNKGIRFSTNDSHFLLPVNVTGLITKQPIALKP